ncbi:MAG: acyl-CoA/acyl-ACP dehydrogenase [Dehalococcoidales bacterium]|nr:acyl-CoA/acyl-ACP dehydrogenase [Dehalococcoidales bacterium]
MDFDLNEEQEMLKTAARDFLSKECPKALVKAMAQDERGYPPELWNKITELGWPGLVFPEQYGGSGGSFLNLTVLVEEMGRACLPVPFFSTVVLGGLFILNAGSEEQQKDLLTRVTQGEVILTLALTEPTAGYEAASVAVEAAGDNGDYIINGTKLFIPDAHIADYLICIARTGKGTVPEEGITAFLVDAKSPGISCTVLKTIAGDKLCEVVFDDVRVPHKNIVGKLNQGWVPVAKTLQQATVAKCAEMVGGAQQVLEMSAEYTKERIVFGRRLGSFPVIQQYIANMMIDVDSCRFLTYEAAWKLSEGLPCAMETHMAKAWASEAYQRVTALGQQIFGGVGFIQDHDMPLYFRRAKAAESTLGDSYYHREQLAQLLTRADSSAS